jgi:hypothetical protein
MIAALLSHRSAAETTPLHTTITLGYDSRYVLYGYQLSRHLYHADAYLSKALNEKTSVWGGGWYGYLTDGTYHEVDVYGGIDRQLNDRISVGFAYSMFNYIEVPFPADDRAHEFTVHATYAMERFSLSLRNQYDTEAKGSLVRGIATFSQPVTDAWSVIASAETGYALEYYVDGNLWNHALFKVQAPYQINDRLGLTPFISRSIALAAIDDFETDVTYYGISLGISF